MAREDRPTLFDEDIRILLFDYLDLRYPKVRTFEEKVMGKSRSDVVALLPDALVGIEIKSDADTYARLATQVKDYDKFFDMNYIVVGSSHLRRVAEHIPTHWGILHVDQTEEEPIIREVRAAGQNPKIKLKTQFVFMWKRELWALLKLNNLPAYKQKSRKFIVDTLLSKVDERTLKMQMCDMLFERDYSIFEAEEE
ncbi:MAG: sce7726 family protein [Clostridia bacterium]|nr:sce7726 family protein [Clostridia bacterium]